MATGLFAASATIGTTFFVGILACLFFVRLTFGFSRGASRSLRPPSAASAG